MQTIHKPKFIVSGAMMTLAVMAIVAFSLFTTLKPASAEELTQQSLTKVSQLSPEALHELDLKVNGDPKAELQAAKNAKDLQILTYDQLQKLDDGSPSTARTGPTDTSNDGPSSLDAQSLKYLRYTDNDGTVHTIGVGKDGLPVIVMTFRNNGDGSSEGSVQVTGGKSGQMSTSMSGQASATAMPTGVTSCKAGDDGKMTCTNADGSAAPAPNCQTQSNGSIMCSASAMTQTAKP